VIRVPVAHHDGNYFVEAETLAAMRERDQIAFSYCAPDGGAAADANPNGSLEDIAGVYNETKTVLGLMPHPERLADPLLGGIDGRPLFDGLVEALS
jgi:phosphoribosylformylglycinamidine synthase